MSAELSSLLLALGIFSVGFVSIGPNILAIIGTSMERGRHAGVRLALGVGSGSAVWATLTVAGLTALITAYAGVVTLLKIFGAAYLLWLAYKAFRSAATPVHLQKPKAAGGRNLYLQGIAIQLTNPKAALQWIAIVGIGLGNEAPLWVGLALIVTATLLSLAVHVLYAVTFSTTLVVAAYRKSRRWIEGALGLFFSFAAFKIATYRQ
ncbi:MAG: LysE family translocator [Phyllobacteriaceae bacterium]|jgi:threonine/homoserine/homoserine lactone efflux protein|nr:LysE family translocator [Phyllobacteriaceae bacterium]